MKQALGPLGDIDLLTSRELREAMGHHFDQAIREWYRGVDYLGFAGPGGAATVTVPGPDSGFVWSVRMVSAQLASATVSTTPTVNAIPLGATTVATYNNNSVGVNLTISGGTVTVIAINGTTTGLTSGTFFVPAGGTVTLTYSAPPTTFTTAGIPVTSPSAFSVYPGDNTTVAPLGTTTVVANGTSNDAVIPLSSEQAVLKDQRNLTLFSGVTILNWRVLVKSVPAEMQGKL